MQFFGAGKPPVGVIFDSDMGTRIDTTLALALLYGLDGKNETRVVSLSTTRSDLSAAQFYEVAGRFYASNTSGPLAAFQRGLPIGLATSTRITGSTPLLKSVLERRNDKDALAYSYGIKSINDTAEPRSLLRNALTAQHDDNAIVVLAGPATNLASAMALAGVKDLIVKKVRYLVVSAGSFPTGSSDTRIETDIAAAKKVFSEWPTPIVACGSEAAAQLLYPASSIEKDYSYTPNHPIADAYRAFKPMPYDAPTTDMAAMLYAVRPKENYFKLSDPGVISVQDDGRLKFTAAASGRHRYLIADPEQHDAVIKAYVELASAKPVQRVMRFRKMMQDEQDKDKAKDKAPEIPKPPPDGAKQP